MGRIVAAAIGVFMVVLGGLWTFRGLGYLEGSPMTGVAFYAQVGPAIAGLGVALLIVTLRRRPGPDA